jgi:hypothetical protein
LIPGVLAYSLRGSRGMKAAAEAAIAAPAPDHIRAADNAGLPGKSLWERMTNNHRNSIVAADQWISELTDAADIEKLLGNLLGKAGRLEELSAWRERLHHAIGQNMSARDFLAAAGGNNSGAA